MKQRYSLALAAALAAGGAAIPACGGDDNGTTSSTPEAGTPDSTTDESSVSDGMVASGDGAVSHPDGAADGGLPPADGGGQCTGFDASGLDDASVAAGFQSVWQVYRCAGCHQKTSQKVDDAGGGIVLSGNNDGIGDSGMVFPPNLTGDPATGVGCWTNDELIAAILQGKDPEGGTLCPSMPKWGTALQAAGGGPRAGTPMDAGTARAIVEYLRSLPVVGNSVPDTTCPAAGDAGDAAPE